MVIKIKGTLDLSQKYTKLLEKLSSKWKPIGVDMKNDVILWNWFGTPFCMVMYTISNNKFIYLLIDLSIFFAIFQLESFFFLLWNNRQWYKPLKRTKKKCVNTQRKKLWIKLIKKRDDCVGKSGRDERAGKLNNIQLWWESQRGMKEKCNCMKLWNEVGWK